MSQIIKINYDGQDRYFVCFNSDGSVNMTYHKCQAAQYNDKSQLVNLIVKNLRNYFFEDELLDTISIENALKLEHVKENIKFRFIYPQPAGSGDNAYICVINNASETKEPIILDTKTYKVFATKYAYRNYLVELA